MARQIVQRGPSSGRKSIKKKLKKVSELSDDVHILKASAFGNTNRESQTNSPEAPYQEITNHVSNDVQTPITNEEGNENPSKNVPPGWKKRSARPGRDAKRALKRLERGGQVASNGQKQGRGPNQAQKLKPDVDNGEARWPLIFNKKGQPICDNSIVFGYYLGDEARHYQRFPLHEEWGDTHRTSFEELFLDAQRYYEFLGLEDQEKEGERVECPTILVKEFMKLSVQDKVRSFRNEIKNDYFIRWLWADSQQECDKIVANLDDRIPKDKWPELCKYFEDPKKMAEAKRNKSNRNSDTDRPSSTSGVKSHSRRMHELMVKYKSDYNVGMGYDACHMSEYDPDTRGGVYPNASTEKYLKNIRKESTSRGIDLTKEVDQSVLTPILNALSGGPHGGYERGMGMGPSKSMLKKHESTNRLFHASSEKELMRLRDENKKLKEENGTIKEELRVCKEKQVACGVSSPSVAPSINPTPPPLPNFSWQQPPSHWYPPWGTSAQPWTAQTQYPPTYTQPPSSWPTSNREDAGLGEILATAIHGGWNGVGGFNHSNRNEESNRHGGSVQE